MSPQTLVLTDSQRRQLAAAAQAAHPEECCGLLLGRVEGADEEAGEVAEECSATVIEAVVPAPNVSTRDRRRHYAIDPERVLQAHRPAAGAARLVGFYHSHPDGSARPSARDVSDAWPGMSYLIQPRGGEPTSWRRTATGELAPEEIVTQVAAARGRRVLAGEPR